MTYKEVANKMAQIDAQAHEITCTALRKGEKAPDEEVIEELAEFVNKASAATWKAYRIFFHKIKDKDITNLY